VNARAWFYGTSFHSRLNDDREVGATSDPDLEAEMDRAEARESALVSRYMELGDEPTAAPVVTLPASAGDEPASAQEKPQPEAGTGSLLVSAARLVSHAVSVLTLLTITSGCVEAAEPNLVGSLTLNVWGMQYEGETWASFRWSGGAYAPTDENATSTHGTILSHPYFRLSVPEAADLAAGLRAWQAQHHNVTVYDKDAGPMSLSLAGNDGVTWGPDYDPVVTVSLKWWLLAGERGEMHGEMYQPLTEAHVETLATALETWVANPSGTSRATIFTAVAQ
jgi:hypothetical protein